MRTYRRLQLNLGKLYYQNGYFSDALRTWEKAWHEGRELIGPASTIVSDVRQAYWSMKNLEETSTGRANRDIAKELCRLTDKPSWAYLTEEDFKRLADHCNPKYRPLAWLMYDSGLRVTEAYSIRVEDFSDNFQKFHIPDEVSKNLENSFRRSRKDFYT